MNCPARKVEDPGEGRNSRTAGERHCCYLYTKRFQLDQLGQILLPGKREADYLVPHGKIPDDIEHHRAAAVHSGVG
jgi:hypothetical protein